MQKGATKRGLRGRIFNRPRIVGRRGVLEGVEKINNRASLGIKKGSTLLIRH